MTMLTIFQKAKLAALLPEIAQRTGIPYIKLVGLLCDDDRSINATSVIGTERINQGLAVYYTSKLRDPKRHEDEYLQRPIPNFPKGGTEERLDTEAHNKAAYIVNNKIKHLYGKVRGSKDFEKEYLQKPDPVQENQRQFDLLQEAQAQREIEDFKKAQINRNIFKPDF